MDFYPGGIDREAAQANPPVDVKRCCATCDLLFRRWGDEFWQCDYVCVMEPKTYVCEHWLWNCPW